MQPDTTPIEQLLAEAGVPGVAVALLVDGQPLLQAGLGYRDPTRTEPLPAGARFYLYSITKTLIAVAVLKLVAEGTLSLDRPLQAYLPAFPLEQPLTLRHILRHTAGLPDYGPMPAYAEAVRRHPGHPWTEAHFLEQTLAGGLRFAPGSGWAYSNIGYLLLKQLLEQISGLSLRRLLHEQLFRPLGLARTFVAETLADATTLTPGYTTFFDDDERLEDMHKRYHPGWVSHGVVVSTAPETATLFHALFSGQLLPPALLAQMLTPVPVPVTHPPFVRPAYGLGLMLDPQSPYGLVAGHGGGGPGYDTAALHFADVAGQEVVAVLLANRDGAGLALRLAFRLVSKLEAHQ